MNATLTLTASSLKTGYAVKRGLGQQISGPLNLSLYSGMILALLGENGSGKSTLLRTLSGLQPPLQGNIELMGKSLSRWSRGDLARRVSLVLTQFTPPLLSVRELVSMGRYPYTGWLGTLQPEDTFQIEQAMELTGTARLAATKILELSDGQRQRALIARALAQDTPVIMMDEPTSHLDWRSRKEVFSLLQRLATELDKSILFTSHEAEPSLRLADQVCILQHNGMVVSDRPWELIQNDLLDDAYYAGASLAGRLPGLQWQSFVKETLSVYYE